MRKRIWEHKVSIAGTVLAIMIIALFGIFAYAQEGEEQTPPPPANGEAEPAQEQPSEEDSNSSTGDQPADETTPQDPPSAESTNTETPKPEPGVDAAVKGLGKTFEEKLEALKGLLQDAPPPSGTPAGANAVSETGSSDQPSLLDTFKKLDQLNKDVRQKLALYRSLVDESTVRDLNGAISLAEEQLRRRKLNRSVNATLTEKSDELRRLTDELRQINDLLGAEEAPEEGK